MMPACRYVLALTSFIVLFNARAVQSQNISHLQSLEHFLFNGDMESESPYFYDKTVRPNPFSTLEIEGEFYVLAIAYTDEKNGYIGVSGVFVLYWFDDRLKWDPSKFGDINSLSLEAHSLPIWLPNFLHNGNRFIDGTTSAATVTVGNDGRVTEIMYFYEHTPCLFDMTQFPYDRQTCTIRLTHVGPKVVLKSNMSTSILIGDGLEDNLHHQAWKFVSANMTSPKYLHGSTSMSLFNIDVTIERYPTFFVHVYVAPICFLLLLMPIIFLLPPDSHEKLTYGAILLLSMIFVLDRMESVYPSYSSTTPYIVKLSVGACTMLFICILLSSLLSSFERIGRARPLPAWMKKYVIGMIGPFLLVREIPKPLQTSVHLSTVNESDSAAIIKNEQTAEFQGQETVEDGMVDNASHKDSGLKALVAELRQARLNAETNEGWTLVFTIVDRFLFLLTLIIAIILMLCFTRG